MTIQAEKRHVGASKMHLRPQNGPSSLCRASFFALLCFRLRHNHAGQVAATRRRERHIMGLKKSLQMIF